LITILQLAQFLNRSIQSQAYYRRNNPNDDAIFSFDFEGFPTNPITVRRSNHQNTLLPVGSVVISDLDYASFCSMNGIPSTGDNSELIWVPADGRVVTGSNYGEKKNIVPDYRGTFLRGLNIFDPVNNPVYTKAEQKDYENRSVNHLQLCSVQKHKHNIEDPGHSHNSRTGSGQADGGEGNPYARNDAGYNVETGTTSSVTNIKVLENEGSETRPTNVAVYYYIKIN